LGNDEVPGGHEAALFPPTAFQVMGTLWPEITEDLQVSLVDHQAFPVLLQEKADLGRGRGVAQVLHVGSHLVEIEKLHGLKGAPYLLPTPSQVGPVEDIHESPLQTRYPDLQARAIGLDHIEGGSELGRQSPRKADPLELMGPESDGPSRGGGKIGEVLVDRIAFAVKLHGCMVGQHGILRHPGGQQEGIDGIGLGRRPGWNNGIETAAHPDQPARPHVIEQEGLLRPGIARAFSGEEGGKFITLKDRVFVEKMFEFHRIVLDVYQRYAQFIYVF